MFWTIVTYLVLVLMVITFVIRAFLKGYEIGYAEAKKQYERQRNNEEEWLTKRKSFNA